jgi:uncharacterized Zn-binding protein involved in type VI secretion
VKAAGRVGDRARASEDAEDDDDGDLAAPATTGSADVLVGGRPALRLGDGSHHDGHDDTWTVVGGSADVIINDRPAVRAGDPTRHRGGDGCLAEGSDDVLVGGG